MVETATTLLSNPLERNGVSHSHQRVHAQFPDASIICTGHHPGRNSKCVHCYSAHFIRTNSPHISTEHIFLRVVAPHRTPLAANPRRVGMVGFHRFPQRITYRTSIVFCRLRDMAECLNPKRAAFLYLSYINTFSITIHRTQNVIELYGMREREIGSIIICHNIRDLGFD